VFRILSRLLGPACIGVVVVILCLGLWPFHAPRNQIRWARNGRGVAYGSFGTILGTGSFGAGRSGAGTIEIWVQPDRWTFSTMLSLYNSRERKLFRLRQSLDALIVEPDADQSVQLYVRRALLEPLLRRKPVLISVTTGPDGCYVYLDGRLSRATSQVLVPADTFDRVLIVGDSPWQTDSFRGTISGLAIYDGELTAAQVSRHYQSWMLAGHPDLQIEDRNLALYLFDEHAGHVIHNRVSAAGDLLIPDRYTIVDKMALQPFWTEFELSRSYWSGNLKNIVGFLPVGFFFYAYFVVRRPIGRPVLVTVALGALLSLTIEVFQAFLPSRDSGTTDIITNTIGTWLGALLYGRLHIHRFASGRDQKRVLASH